MFGSASAALATAVMASYFSTGSSISIRSSFQPWGTKTPNFAADATMVLPFDEYPRPTRPGLRRLRAAAIYVPAVASLARTPLPPGDLVRRKVDHCRTNQVSEHQ